MIVLNTIVLELDLAGTFFTVCPTYLQQNNISGSHDFAFNLLILHSQVTEPFLRLLDPSTPLLFFAVDTVRCLSTPASSLLLWFLCKQTVQTVQQSLYCLFFYVIFPPHTFSHSLKFWTITTTPPFSSVVLLLSTFLSSFS